MMQQYVISALSQKAHQWFLIQRTRNDSVYESLAINDNYYLEYSKAWYTCKSMSTLAGSVFDLA